MLAQGLFYFIPTPYMNALNWLRFDDMLRKIPAALKQTDARVTQAQQQGERPAARVGFQEYLSAPWMMPKPVEPMSHYDAARFCWNAYATDGRFHAAINKTAFKATQPNANRRPFEIEVQLDAANEKEQMWEALHNVFNALSVYRRVRSMVTAGLVEGESYYRMVVDREAGRVVALKKIKGPRSGFEIYGPIDNPEFPQYYGMYMQVNKGAANQPVNLFYNWEVLPIYWNFDEEMERAAPLGLATKSSYLNTTDTENYITIARRWRSGKRLVHNVGAVAVTDDQFRERVQAIKALQQSAGKMEPFSDLYVNAEGGVTTLDETSASLWNINDIQHHQGVYFDGLQTPRALYSAGSKDVPNRSVMDVIYDEWLSSYVAAAEDMLTGDVDPRGIHGDGLLKLVELQLNLLGKTSRLVPVAFTWPSKSRLTAEELKAWVELRKTGKLSDTTYFAKLGKVDLESEMEMQLREQAAAFEQKKLLLKHEIELAKLQKERDRLLGKGDTNDRTVNEPEADDEDLPGKNGVDVESLLGRRNGFHRHLTLTEH